MELYFIMSRNLFTPTQHISYPYKLKQGYLMHFTDNGKTYVSRNHTKIIEFSYMQSINLELLFIGPLYYAEELNNRTAR